ncbi:hypothetical protein PG993_011763 [Apiospora rasikravindrae]|uniref:Secreted protein n=1 Tax=Apiospora rasikravindrae TaxID=990691 RepID=A0ABR1S0I6_9PEZI
MWLTLTLFALLCHILVAMAAPTFGEVGWWYSRCSSPTQVEASMNQENWVPSSICLHGTCCSNLAEGPLCTYEACALVEEEMGGKKRSEPNSLAKRDTRIWPQPAVRRSSRTVSSTKDRS